MNGSYEFYVCLLKHVCTEEDITQCLHCLCASQNWCFRLNSTNERFFIGHSECMWDVGWKTHCSRMRDESGLVEN